MKEHCGTLLCSQQHTIAFLNTCVEIGSGCIFHSHGPLAVLLMIIKTKRVNYNDSEHHDDGVGGLWKMENLICLNTQSVPVW